MDNDCQNGDLVNSCEEFPIHLDDNAEQKVEVATYSKRKRVHMDASDCLAHGQTEQGALPLVNPAASNPNTDSNNLYNLYPVIINKCRKTDTENRNSAATSAMSYNQVGCNAAGSCGSLSNSQGFVSASNMYNIAKEQKPAKEYDSYNKTNSNHSLFKNNSFTAKRGKNIKQIVNQSSIVGFMKTSTPTNTKDPIKTEDLYTSIQEERLKKSPRSVMYSPIKRVDNSQAIYISDSSPSSSQGSQPNSQTQKETENSVVKQLFNAQKNLDSKSKKQVKSKTKTSSSAKSAKSSFVQSKELAKIKDEFAKYFESDSFDINAAFNSDMEDNCETTNQEPKSNTVNTKPAAIEKPVADKYGLLGSGSYQKNQDTMENYFERLPFEVLENIFCQLPMLDLCLNSNRVCLQWNEIIADEKFVPWKKLYHKLKKDMGTSRNDVQDIMRQNGMMRPADYLGALIRYMRDLKRISAGNMLQCLQRHTKYPWAKALIQERFQDCLIHGEPNPWSVITALVIVSHDVYEIQDIIRCLSISTSQCTSTEILECLYCIATFLYAFKLARRGDVWNGMHYRLFYALYLYENASSSSCADLQGIMSSSNTGQQSLFKYSTSTDSVRLTHEQLRIVKHQTRADEVIKIVAFAGTGKTTTLAKYTQLRPNKKFLLVVYNKSVREYALTKFPKNVECRTGHSLAFARFGRRYANKLFGIKVYTLTQTLPPRKGDNLFIRAKFVMTTIENFLSSADPCISYNHVPDERVNDKTGFREHIDLPAKRLYVGDAEYIWGRMQNIEDKKVGMSHDGYLKMYQLSRPRLTSYDCILIDEAQDLTPAIIDILLHQPQGKILVGDPHQQIYSFRGAINAMDTITAHTIFYLTQSFRFGPEIAQVAACCLEELKKEKKKTLVGSGKKCSIMGEQVGQLAIISRSNATVFSEAVKKCCYSDEQCKVAFIGGTNGFGFPMIMDMYALTLPPEDRVKEGYEIQNKFIKIFKTFVDLENFATKCMDNELLGKIRIVKSYHHNLPVLIRKIESKCVRDERQADYVFSTAHKAKGLEFSTVRVTDDFLQDQQPTAMVPVDLGDMGHMMGNIIGGYVERLPPQQAVNVPLRQKDESTDEENLLYVALTRAKHALQMSPTIVRVLHQAGEKFQYPVYSEALTAAGTEFKCKETDAIFKPNALTLEKKSVKLGDGTVLPGGLYSPAILSEDFGSYSKLLGLTPAEMDTKTKDTQKALAVNAEVFYG